MITLLIPSLNTSNALHYMPIVWLKRAYINPFSNASDIGKAMKYQGFSSKSPLD
jgi:hypothetical protein